MKCEKSGLKQIVSDYNVLIKEATCPLCNQKVKISFPDKDRPNLAKYKSHSIQKDKKI